MISLVSILIIIGFSLFYIYNIALDKFEITVDNKITSEFEDDKLKETLRKVAYNETRNILKYEVNDKIDNFNRQVESSKRKLIKSVDDARDSLRGLGVVIVSLEDAAKGGIESVLDNPNFQEEIFNILTGLPPSMFIQYHNALDLFEMGRYEDSLKLIAGLIDEYEEGAPWDLEDYSRYEFNKQVNSFYILAAEASNRVGNHKLSYDFSIRALYYGPTYNSFYTAAISAYNNEYYDQSLDMIDRAISLGPPEASLPLYLEVKEKTIEKMEEDDEQE